MKVISVTPAGRHKYLELLAKYLLRQRDLIDEHYWWLNTREPEDVAYIYRLVDRYPGFFRVIAKPIHPRLSIGESIWAYLRECTALDTLYLRFDDDICYMAEDAVANLIAYRQQHREPLLVLGNIVNNAICTHFQQQAGVIPASWDHVSNDCWDEVGHGSGVFARRLHRRFLKNVERGEQDKWKRTSFPIDGTSRFSVNVISWFGADLQGLPELRLDRVDEEPFLTQDLPARLERPNQVCSEALFAHYAFYTQRPFLEWTSPDILERYLQIERGLAPTPRMHRPLLNEAFDGLRWSVNSATWIAKNGSQRWRHSLRNLTKRARSKRAA